MTEDRERLLRHYREMRAELLVAIEGLSDAQMSDASLDGWSVKDHLGHIALWDEVRAVEIERISAGFESGWRVSDQQSEAYNELGYAMRRGWSAVQARWELDTMGLRVLDAISDASTRGLDPSFYGEAGLRSRHEAEHTGWIRRWRAEQGL